LREFPDEKLRVVVDASFGKIGEDFALSPKTGAGHNMDSSVTGETDIKFNVPTDTDTRDIDDGASAGIFKIQQIVIDFLKDSRRVKVLPCLRGIFPSRCGK